MAAKESLIKRLAKKLGEVNQLAIDTLAKIGTIDSYPGTRPKDLWFKLHWYQFAVLLPGDAQPTTYLVYATRAQRDKIKQYAPQYGKVLKALSDSISRLQKALRALDDRLRKSVTEIRTAMGLPTPIRTRGQFPEVGACTYRDDNGDHQCAEVTQETCTIAN